MKKVITEKFLQNDDYSCTACVLRFALQYLNGKTISKNKAVSILRCKPNGASFGRLKKAFKQYGFKAKELQIRNDKIREALKQNKLVVIDDIFTHEEDPHAMLIYAYKNSRLHIFDSFAKPFGKRVETMKTVIKNATECFVLE